MRTQETETQGLNLSPIRASFQKVPKGPVFCLEKSKDISMKENLISSAK